MAGFIASSFGEKNTFVIMGIAAALVLVVLYFVTPKKLKVPQSVIRTWAKP